MNMDNYPLGAANDPDAPWNQVEEPDEKFDVEITYTLTKRAMVEAVSEDDINNAIEDQVYSPKELIDILRKRLEKEFVDNPTRHTRMLIKACKDWVYEGFEYDTY